MKNVPDGIFKPKATIGEKKQDATDRAAKSIVDGEIAKREAKTERLRLARLERESTEPAIAAKAPRGRSTAKA